MTSNRFQTNPVRTVLGILLYVTVATLLFAGCIATPFVVYFFTESVIWTAVSGIAWFIFMTTSALVFLESA